MNPPGVRAAAFLACAAILVVFGPGMRPAKAETTGTLSEVAPALEEGLALGGPVTLEADRISYDEDTGVAFAEGNVEVGFGDRTIRADRIQFNTESGEAEFVGNVHYEQEGDEFSFDRIVLNMRTELGVLYNGKIRISSNQFQIASERFEKTGKDTFFIRKGEFTTCPCDPEPDWKFGIRHSRMTIDGYAVARDVTFRIRDVPVLWFPWAAFPVKLKRQSGLLIPTFSHSSTRGSEIELPFYWAINRWSDATFTLDAMTKRGFRPEAEYRFALNSKSEADIRATVFHDKETKDTRYRYYGENRFQYAEHWSANARWDIPSDDQYYYDMVEEDILRTAQNVPSRGFTAWRGSNDSHALSVTWVEDVQGTPDDNTVQRLPQYSATVLPRTLGETGVAAGGDLQATYFYRRAGDREARGRGSVDFSRPITLYPAVFFTPYFSVDFLGAVPTSDSTGTETAGRVVPYGGANLELDFRREFLRSGGTRFVHSVIPGAGFRWVPGVEQTDIPVTDMWDRVIEQRQFLFSLYQRLLRVDKNGPSEVATLELSWALEMAERNAPAPYVDPLSPFVRTLRREIDLAVGGENQHISRSSDLFARFRVIPARDWSLFGESLFNPGDSLYTMARVGGQWRKSELNRVLLEYRLTRDLSEDIHAQVNFRPFRVMGLKTTADYSIQNGNLTEGSATLTWYPRSDCWSVGLKVDQTTRPNETSFRLMFSLSGIGSVGI